MNNGLLVYAAGFLAAGFFSGILSGLFGIGGIVRIPILYALFLFFGVDDSIIMLMAIGTSLALSVPSSVINFLKEYRSWRVDEEKDRISDFLKGWVPPLALGIFGGLIAARYLPDGVLITIFILAALFIAVQVFVFRDSYSPVERFSGRISETVIALVTGSVSTLAALSGVFTRAVLKVFAYPGESPYAAAASGILISVIGAIGYVVIGYGVSGKRPFTFGYVDLLAAVMMLPGSLAAPWFGRKFGSSPGLRKFTKDMISDRLTEPLTGLYNSRHFDSVLSYFVAHADTFSAPVSVLMIDVDNLTLITEKHGQKTANCILLEVGSLLSVSIRRIDIAASYGGDEFTIIMPGADKGASLAAADRIIERLKTIEVKSHRKTVPVSFSVGISTYPAAAVDRDSLVKRAEQAMYESKRNGRDRITHHEDITAG